MRTTLAPISFILTKWSLLQWPCICSLSGSEIANPRNSTVLPWGSTNLFALTEISGMFFALTPEPRPRGGRSAHQRWVRSGAVCAGGEVCAHAEPAATSNTIVFKRAFIPLPPLRTITDCSRAAPVHLWSNRPGARELGIIVDWGVLDSCFRYGPDQSAEDFIVKNSGACVCLTLGLPLG